MSDASADVQTATTAALAVRGDRGQQDDWLWQHGQHLARVSSQIATFDEYRTLRVNHAALERASWFCSAGWAVEINSGARSRWEAVSRPTSDAQRELGATLLERTLTGREDPEVIRVATATIRRMNERSEGPVEALILVEAELLAEVSLLEFLRQVRGMLSEGRSLSLLMEKWQRQVEYEYWDARIAESARTESGAAWARRRVAELSDVMRRVERTLAAQDLAASEDHDAPEHD